MNYLSPHSSKSVICAQPAGQGSLLVAVVIDVNFHCGLLAPNSHGFTTQSNALKSFILSTRNRKLDVRLFVFFSLVPHCPRSEFTFQPAALFFYFTGIHSLVKNLNSNSKLIRIPRYFTPTRKKKSICPPRAQF